MKPTPTSRPESEAAPLLVFGAHPDDIEFGCGAVVARETSAGRSAHFVVCSLGEAGSNGTPAQRFAEAEKSAALLGATLEIVDLGGDSHFEYNVPLAIKLAGIIRRVRPGIVLAPTTVENQHPDHAKLGRMVRDAARLARYGGLEELKAQAAHTIGALLFYAIMPEAEPRDALPVFLDVSAPGVVEKWTAAMEAHASQAATRNYVELQLTRARTAGLRCGVGHAVVLFSSDPPVFDSLAPLARGARQF